MNVIPVMAASGEFQTQAQDVAQKWQLPLAQTETDSGLVLWLNEYGLALKTLDDPKMGVVQVDFAASSISWRRQHGGGKNEAIAKAVGIKGSYRPAVLDATAGLGRDAFILASLGCHLTLLERSNVVSALLDDGLQRAAQDQELGSWLPERMHLLSDSAVSVMARWQGQQPDVVYLDPMFPHRKKSALVKKEMRLFQQLLGPDDDADSLLQPALQLAQKRVVVKRPAGAPWLNQKKPHIQMTGRANRFDVYLIHGSKT
ncbi:class I SAM-dependent methyltransferase [Lacimicrobium alkaliphilum]|uniref:Ribosomal RNA small subunit methyltransferase J n=1 Tax=Lacimicrobium alkaliphilum TaxID=1526571 RepID=A0ABQ1R9W8_9ALTE|nr:class I SAM-dependent methyltransferase [Lacimicrobium alkaliphilum]GGD59981.1 ribosomal RNA small subunit methyltransferase J [Lacimicrobium alkaliphilum]